MVSTQFFARPFWITLAAQAAVFGASVALFEHPAAPVVLVAVLLLVAGISFYRLELGLAIAFAELFGHAHGHLVSMDAGGFAVSLRMAVFVAVLSGWTLRLLGRKSALRLNDRRFHWFLPLIGAVAIGFSLGFASDPRAAFQDGNGYFYLAYLLPILSVDWTARSRRLFLQVLTASAAWVAFLTLGLVYVFAHVPEWQLGEAYRFIRDTRTGELTKMADGIFRVFLQAQISCAILLLLLSPLLWSGRLGRRGAAMGSVAIACMLSAILVSLSRTFWIALVPAAALSIALVLRFMKPGWKRAGRAVAWHGAAFAASIALILFAAFFPFPRFAGGSVSDLTGLFASRGTEFSGDAAIDSRWKLLDPMAELIRERPVSGWGFGTRVEFVTDDPRIRAEHPDGRWSTYALEWGWLELWLKMGILGPAAFLTLGIFLVQGLWPLLRSKRDWLGIGLVSCLAFVYAAHVFSPYLNHPLGLGLILFLIPFVPQKDAEPPGGTALGTEDRMFARRPQASIAPLISE